MWTRWLAVALVAVGVVGLMVGCEPETEDGGEEGGKLTVGVIPKANVFTFWPTVKKGAEAACAELDVTMHWRGAENETAFGQQIEIVETMITDDKIKGIVLAPQSATALVDVVKKAKEAGKPVVIIDSGLNGEHHISFVATDNYQGGVMGAERLGKLLGGKGEVALIRNIPGSASTEAREKGFIETCEQKFPDMKIVAKEYAMGDPTKANEVVSAILTGNPNLKGIFTANEPGAIGALNAAKGANKLGQIKIVGFDASPTLIAGIRDGSLDSTIVQDPFTMGKRGVEILVAKLNGKDVPKEEKTPIELVTKDNLDTDKIKGHLAAYGIGIEAPKK
ncbi:substrate-binding domain-containing protein [Planctomycetota bacterium]